MNRAGGVICDPDVLERLGISEDDDAAEDDGRPLLPAKMAGPEEGSWPLPEESGWTYVDESVLRRGHPGVIATVPVTKLRG